MKQEIIDKLDAVEVDWEGGTKRVNGSEQLYLKLLVKFLNDKNYASFKDDFGNGDWEEAKRSIHALKGLSANMGMKRLHSECIRIETDMKNGDIPESLKKIDECYSEVASAIMEIEKYIET